MFASGTRSTRLVAIEALSLNEGRAGAEWLKLLLQELPLPAYSVDGEVPESEPMAGEDDALPF